MARKAKVRLRALSRREQATLRAKVRQVSLPARVHRRYRVIALIRAGHPVGEAARAAGLTAQGAYELLHRFNDSGFASFERPNNPRGRIPILTERQLQDLVDTALSSPQTLGLPFTTWSVRTLSEYCRKKKLIPSFSDEWVRRLLRRQSLSAQRIRTWKHSDDPGFAKKQTHPLPHRAPPAARGGRQLR
ncbi:MAG: hypothetical protein ACRDF0_07950 [Candidatus Limnocylindria bacterium]